MQIAWQDNGKIVPTIRAPFSALQDNTLAITAYGSNTSSQTQEAVP